MNDVTAWYAVRTRSNFEKRVTEELAAKGFDVYLPCFREVHQWKDRKKAVTQPLFPGYLFSRFVDAPERRVAVLRTAGVAQILGSGNLIEPVADLEMESIRRMLSAGVGCFAHPFMREGQRVRIRRGCLKGIEGLLARVKDEYRLVLSVELLCRSVAIEVDAQDVEPAGVATASRRVA